MSIYRVLYNGIDIYDPTKKELTLISPVLDMEAGAAGSLEFTMPPNHIFYNNIVPMGGDIEVYEDDELIWFGRPRTPTMNFYKQRVFHCEGALAFLNDSIQTKETIDGLTTYEILDKIIKRHNSMVSTNRQFLLGDVTVNYNKNQYREFDHENSMDAVRKFVIGTDGGYLFVRKENETIYLDWYADMPFTCNQPIQLALNMIDLAREDSYDEFCTGVYAIGGQNSAGTNVEVGNIIWASDEIRKRYGDIVVKVEFPEITDTTILTEKAREYLTANQFANTILELEGVDLHPIEGKYEKFKVGQNVRCISTPHFLNAILPLTRMVIKLDSGLKTITLGTPKEQSLTKIQRLASYKLDNLQSEGLSLDALGNASLDALTLDNLIIIGQDGYKYGLEIDTEQNVIATQLPEKIEFTGIEIPDFISPTAVLDYEDIVVEAIKPDGTVVDVTANCVFDPSIGTLVSNLGLSSFNLMATCNIGGIAYQCSKEVTVLTVKEIVIEGLPDTVLDNYVLSYEGVTVKAIMNDGTEVDVTDECTLEPKEGLDVSKFDGNLSEFDVIAVYNYKGTDFAGKHTIYINNEYKENDLIMYKVNPGEFIYFGTELSTPYGRESVSFIPPGEERTQVENTPVEERTDWRYKSTYIAGVSINKKAIIILEPSHIYICSDSDFSITHTVYKASKDIINTWHKSSNGYSSTQISYFVPDKEYTKLDPTIENHVKATEYGPYLFTSEERGTTEGGYRYMKLYSVRYFERHWGLRNMELEDGYTRLSARYPSYKINYVLYDYLQIGENTVRETMRRKIRELKNKGEW